MHFINTNSKGLVQSFTKTKEKIAKLTLDFVVYFTHDKSKIFIFQLLFAFLLHPSFS